MGNCHCRPKEGGENLRQFLTRKFRSISGKRKIDDIVTIAIHEEKISGKSDELHLDLTDLEDYEYDSDDDDDTTDSDTSSSSDEEKIFTNMAGQTGSQIKSDVTGDVTKKSDIVTSDLPSRQEVVQYKEDNDYIRVLQQQLKQVQSELAKLHRTPIVRSEGLFDTNDQCEGQSICLKQNQVQQSDNLQAKSTELKCATESTGKRKCSTTNDATILHAKGDTSGRPSAYCPDDSANAAGMLSTRIVNREKSKNDGHVTDDMIQPTIGNRRKVQGMIIEGLRAKTAGKQPRSKAQMKTLEQNDTHANEDKAVIEAKIAKLQKRDPALPRPDKGILYPKTLANLSNVDKAYYVEQFLRSELFRQRCLRKYQGSKTWMNGLSPFQLWVLQNEGTADIDTVLHPLAKRRNNAQAKVKCWRGDTPPPPPESP